MAADETAAASDLPSLAVRRPILAIVANLLIVLAGVAALWGVEVRELPEVERPRLTITADYPGAAPATVDAELTRPLEGAAARVAGVSAISSQSEEGGARIVVTFASAVDIDAVANDTREAVSDVRRRLPDGVEGVFVVKADDEADPIVRLAVWSETLDREALSARVDDTIVPELASVPGVAEVQVDGERRRTLTVVVDPLRLASYGLSVADVRDTLATAPFDVPAGSIETASQDVVVRADASVVTVRDVERLVIRGTTRIGDVASAFYGPAEATSRVRWQGRDVVGLGVVRRPQSNTVAVSAGVAEVVAALDRRFGDVEIATTADEAEFIEGALREVTTSLLLGVAIVVAVILLFIGSPRLTLIPAVAIPVALAGTLAGIWLLGFSINILTLLALVLASGILVDDAIVVLENIARVRARGHGALAAAVIGTRQVFFAVIATTATLVSVFLPIAFLPGRAGQLFTEFGIVLAIAVCISSFVALTLVPMLASKLVPAAGERRAGPLRRALEAGGRAAARLYARGLGGALAIPLVVIGVLAGGAFAVGSLVTTLDRELVPEEDRGELVIWLSGPDGVGLAYTDRQVRRVEAALEPLVAAGEARGVYAIAGRYDPDLGYLAVPLAPWGERRPAAAIAAELDAALADLPGARVFVLSPDSLDLGAGGGGELEVAVTGPDYATIAAAGDRLVAAIGERLAGLTAPALSYSTTRPQLAVRIDRERAADLGVDVEGVAATLEAMVDGAEV
ncbi:MAG: MMPL family transporter, partial [Alphaproteobacteria bacterium]|nr:MMPL family transporter [Alphaproteobacteria bacterium]